MTLEVAVRHAQGDFTLDVAFTAGPGVTALFGPSGAGKTTLVRLIAGLARPQAGRIVADGQVLVDTTQGRFAPPHRRRIGMVFQDGQLFPHLSVRQNLLYGRLFAPRGAALPAIGPVIALLGLETLLGRRPRTLSGGEKQRVALGRALLMGPRLVLMDEPLAALDEARKQEILPYVERLRDQAGLSIVYVSHALGEVLRLADTVVRLEAGRVTAVGPAEAVIGQQGAAGAPPGVVLTGHVIAQDVDYGLTQVDTPAGPLLVPTVDLAPGRRLRLHLAARDIMLARAAPAGLSALNVLRGTVTQLVPWGPTSVLVTLACGAVQVPALVTRKSMEILDLSPGAQVFAIVKAVGIDPALIAGRPDANPA
ncbi:molybdenum ABC transporter ATP-binding protein [Zavarzinia sp. CC-PAN008]|uniref:molybdenum ABC transporter ATP-binding protein n=1 Tax=Zavarzinia sp. CC-PAN008 TaxID=3243332 RepID=UPI003F748CAA